MFRAVSLAVFGTQIHHEQLRLRACVIVGLHFAPSCIRQLRMTAVLNFCDEPRWFTSTQFRRSLGVISALLVAVVAIRSFAGLECGTAAVRIHSFFPPLQSAFVSPLTVDIVGRDVTVAARSIAVMWTTMEAVSSQGNARINHVVALVMLSCYCLIEIKSYLLSAFKTRRLLFIIFFAQH